MQPQCSHALVNIALAAALKFRYLLSSLFLCGHPMLSKQTAQKGATAVLNFSEPGISSGSTCQHFIDSMSSSSSGYYLCFVLNTGSLTAAAED